MPSGPFPPASSSLAAPAALALSGVLVAKLYGSDVVSARGFFTAAVCFLPSFVILKRIIPCKKITGMRMTAVESAMCRAVVFPAETKHGQINNIIDGFVWYDEGNVPTVDDVAEHWEPVLKANKRFRAIAIDDRWELKETNVRDHIRSHSVSTETDALALLWNIATAEELDRTQPLWKIEVAIAKTGRSIILIRVHHALGDGIGIFTSVLPKFATAADGSPLPADPPQMPKPPGGPIATVLRHLDSVRSFVKLATFPSTALETDLPCFNPARAELVYSGKREAAFFPPMSLDYIKKVKDAAKVTVNDLMVSAWAGAVRRHCEQRGFVFDKEVVCRMLLPVAVPRDFPDGHDPEDMLVNYFAMLPIPIDLNNSDLQQRLRANKKNLDVVKKTTLATTSLWMVNHFSTFLPVSVQQDSAKQMFARNSVVFSNVPGSREGLRVFGKVSSEMQAVFVNAIPQVIAISVGDRVFMNLCADPDVFKPLQEFPQLYLEEIDAIGKSFGVAGSCSMVGK